MVVGLGAFVGGYALQRRMKLATLARPALYLGGAAVLSVLLYLPFKLDYHTVFQSGMGLVRDISPSMLEQNGIPASQVRDVLLTPLRIYLEHFGFFLFAILTYLCYLLLVVAGGAPRLRAFGTSLQFSWYHRDRSARLWRASRVVRRLRPTATPVLDPALLLGLAIVVLGLLFLQDFLLAILVAVHGLTAHLLLRLAKRLPATQLFVLALLLVPLLLSLGTQIVFVKDWLAGGPDFRMNTIFKFYNQAWVLFAATAAAGLYFFMSGTVEETARALRRPELAPYALEPAAVPEAAEVSARSEESDAVVPLTQARALPPSLAIYQRPRDGNISGNGLGDKPDGQSRLRSVTERWPTNGGGTASADGSFVYRALSPWARPLTVLQRWSLWSLCFVILLGGSLIYTYAGTISRETYRTAWLPESSVPWTLDGSAFMRVAYPGDYTAIAWLNAHVRGAPVIAEAGNPDYDWRSRVTMFTGLPDIINGIHEPEQRYADEFSTRNDDLATLYNSTDTATAWRIIRRYGVRYIYVGFSERQQYSRAGLAKFNRMVGHGLRAVYSAHKTTVYEVVA
jgi:hypothetical protein